MTWQAEPRSPLGWSPCSKCQEPGAALTIERYGSTAVCGPCLAAKTGAGTGTRGSITPVRGTAIGTGPGAPNGVTPIAHPPFVVSSRERGSEVPQTPGPVLELEALAQAYGWRTGVQYAKGTETNGITGGPGSFVHSFAVRIGGHPGASCGAVAVYRTPVRGQAWTWRSVWIWSPLIPWFGGFGITLLKTFIKDIAFRDERAIREWVLVTRQGMEDRATEVKRKAKEKKANSPRKAIPKESGG